MQAGAPDKLPKIDITFHPSPRIGSGPIKFSDDRRSGSARCASSTRMSPLPNRRHRCLRHRHPFTLADLQRLAAENSPTLWQAAADVEAAKGNVIQCPRLPQSSRRS